MDKGCQVVVSQVSQGHLHVFTGVRERNDFLPQIGENRSSFPKSQFPNEVNFLTGDASGTQI